MNVFGRTLALCALTIAANTASAADLTESSINELVTAMDQSIQARSPEGVGRLLSGDFSLTHELKAYGQTQTIKVGKGEYLNMLRQAWALAGAYRYERSQVKITFLPDKASAKVSARIRETITMQGQTLTAVSTSTSTVRLIDGRALITNMSAVMHDSPTP